jgi:hypothetical protein
MWREIRITVEPWMCEGIVLYLTWDVSPLVTTYTLIKLLLVEVNVLYQIQQDRFIH